MIEDILLQVNKPGRYIGREWNAPKKDFAKAEIKFALCFPDLYEIGMSNLGLRIIYGILNSLDGVVCERFFAPDCDMENVLRKNYLQIFSLESRKQLRDFDLVGFSLGYELGYTNVLNMLDLGAIPLESSLRGNEYPLIIAGGPCALNPEPMHEFFDLFVIGEAEEAILEIADAYRKLKHEFKANKISKQDLLVMLSHIEGVYAPSLYEVGYDPSGRVIEFKAKVKGACLKVKKRFVKDLDSAYFPSDWLVPYIQIVHDRISLEAMRGCPNTCRFCQARSQYFPFRHRSSKTILDLSRRLYARTGYEEIALTGLSVSDYPNIEELLGELICFFKPKGVGVSLPSLKPKTMVGNLSSLIATIKKTGLTFAPEAASDKLRGILGKNFDTKSFYNAIEQAYSLGWRHIKLYFMIGLPYEKNEDLDGIIDFSIYASQLRKKVGQPAAQVNISVNTLIPKPHTSFQWFKMENIESIKLKQEYLRKKMRDRRLKMSMHNPYMSVLEGVFSRGDRRLSPVIAAAFRKGARFDAWGNHFVFERWQEAFLETKIDYNFYLQDKSKDELLPWDFIDVGISKEDLLRDYEKVIAIE